MAYVYPKSASKVAANDEEGELDEAALKSRHRQTDRAAWPKKHRYLPEGCVRMSVNELMLKKIDKKTEKAGALITLCSALVRVAGQIALQTIDIDNLNALERHPAVPTEVLDAAKTLGYIAPAGYDKADMRAPVKESRMLTIKNFTNNFRERGTKVVLSEQVGGEAGPSNTTNLMVTETVNQGISTIPEVVSQSTSTKTGEAIVFESTDQMVTLVNKSKINLTDAYQIESVLRWIKNLADKPEPPTVEVLIEHGFFQPIASVLKKMSTKRLNVTTTVDELNQLIDSDWSAFANDAMTLILLVCAKDTLAEKLWKICLTTELAIKKKEAEEEKRREKSS